MHWAQARRATWLALLITLMAPSMAAAADKVSVANAEVNLRSGPGTQHAAQWLLSRGYPLEVIQRRGEWLKVRDFEGDEGWIHRSVTHRVPHHVVKADRAQLRKGPGTQHTRITTLERGEVLRTRHRDDRWVKVETIDGQSGWVARSLLWGW